MKLENYKKTQQIAKCIRTLTTLPNVEVNVCKVGEEISGFNVTCAWQFVPDFDFVWSEQQGHFLVYINIVRDSQGKRRAGNAIANVGSVFAASLFVAMYNFLHRYRANAKTSIVTE